MELRPYQKQAIEAIEQDWERGHRRTLLVLPTGCGKTIVFANVAKRAVARGKKVLILAHRDELLNQAQDKILKATGLMTSKEKAEETSLDSFFRITVGSVQTMQREKRLNRFPSDAFQTIIVDEAHHALANGYQTVLNHFPDAEVLGVTATPERQNVACLGEYFDNIAYEYSLPQAIKEGYLSPIKALTVPLNIDIGGVKMSSGDYAANELGDALSPYLEAIATEMEQYCKERKTVVFLPLVATSKAFRDILNRHGFRAAEVNGNSADRTEILDAFDRGEYNVLCNAMLLTEGWDCPAVDCVVVLRPTKIRSLYQQMVGRGSRLAPEKKDLLLLDFLWLTERHNLCRPASLVCKDEKVAEKMTKRLEDSAGMALDIEEAADEAERDAVAEREASLAKELKAMRERKRKLVDPIQYFFSIEAGDLAGYEPTFMWEKGPATKKQLEYLEKHGIAPDTVENAGLATQLIERLKMRQQNGLSTPKQIRFLERKGFAHVGTWSFVAASSMIGRIAENDWRIPSGIIPAAYKPQEGMNHEAI